jgi:hypothetical protein
LLGEPALFSRRAPGNTCLTALHDGAFGTGVEAIPEQWLDSLELAKVIDREAADALATFGACTG